MTRTTDFGYPGDGGLGDRLLAAVLSGKKTATSSLLIEYSTGEQMPTVGEQLQLVDHSGTPYGIIETTRVEIIPLDEVGDDVAFDEGEDFVDAADWRRAHEGFWHDITEMIRDEIGNPSWVIRSDEPVVVHWFRLLEE